MRVNPIAPRDQNAPRLERDVQRRVRDEENDLAATATVAGRLSKPGEVELLEVCQCSDCAEYVSGSCFRFDAGLTSVPVDGTTFRAA